MKITIVFSVLLIFVLNFCFSVALPGEKQAKRNNEAIIAYNEAQEFENIGEYQKAIECYSKALIYKNIRNSAYYKIGCCYVFLCDYDKAEKIFLELLSKDKKNINIRQSLAFIHAQSASVVVQEQALDEYALLHSENPYNKNIYYGYIKCLLLCNRRESAILEAENYKTFYCIDEEETKKLEELFALPVLIN